MIGNVTVVIIPGLLRGVAYFFAVTAVDAEGRESDFSDEVNYTQAIPTVQIHAVPGGQFILTVTGQLGQAGIFFR